MQESNVLVRVGSIRIKNQKAVSLKSTMGKVITYA